MQKRWCSRPEVRGVKKLSLKCISMYKMKILLGIYNTVSIQKGIKQKSKEELRLQNLCKLGKNLNPISVTYPVFHS